MTDIDSHFAEMQGGKFEVVSPVTFWLDRWACGRWKKRDLRKGRKFTPRVIRLFVGRPVTPGAASGDVKGEVREFLEPLIVKHGLELTKFELLPGAAEETWEEYSVALTVE